MNLNKYEDITISNDYIITTADAPIEPTQSLGAAMFTNLRLNQESIAQIDAKTGQQDTFGQLLQRSIRTVLHMRDKGITRDHIITLCAKNNLNVGVPYIATQFLGAKMASIDPSFSPQEMNHLLNTVRPKIIFATSESVRAIGEVLKEISLDAELVVLGKSTKHTEFSEFLKPHADEDKFEPVEIHDLKETALIYFSSGTTGLPKGICLNHYGFLGHSLNSKVSKNVDEEWFASVLPRMSFPPTILLYTSQYWISAGAMLLSSILEGYCRLICEDFDGKEIWNLFQRFKPSVLLLTPVQAIEMLVNKRIDVDVSCIISIIIIGSAISKEYVLKLRSTFPQTDIYSGYGQTEVCGPVVMFKPMDKHHRELSKRSDKIESVGLPMPGTRLRVVDTETGEHLGPNQRGELLLKSKFTMNGYYKVDSSDTFDKDGWLKTGDIVYYDTDLCFYIVDRIKEAFKYQGWFIAPTVLENVLLEHPAVKLAVVIGIPHNDGHHPMGLVVLNDDSEVSENELEKFVEDRVPERQRLRAGVRFIKLVPVTVTGKVKRSQLKQMVLGGKL
ncbi:luciferin 4-monooxygenase-like isoform X1 [Zophobas morio]|uniref:luciferin 4-monooxygenase-like isoform X1 n=1 Tax=Zophobas morio TaxID=2755281 RepID=UPI0030828930